MGFLAKLALALDCFYNAIRPEQTVFSADFQWLWYFFAIAWVVNAVRVLLEQLRDDFS